MEHMSQPRKTDTLILAAAMEKLSRDIYCEDGVATAAIAEAAERLIELHGEVMSLRANVSRDTARLNSGTILLTVHGERVHYVAQDLRAAIDAGIAANNPVSRDGRSPDVVP